MFAYGLGMFLLHGHERSLLLKIPAADPPPRRRVTARPPPGSMLIPYGATSVFRSFGSKLRVVESRAASAFASFRVVFSSSPPPASGVCAAARDDRACAAGYEGAACAFVSRKNVTTGVVKVVRDVSNVTARSRKRRIETTRSRSKRRLNYTGARSGTTAKKAIDLPDLGRRSAR